MVFTLFPGTVPNMGALGTGGYPMSGAERARQDLSYVDEWANSTYGQQRAEQERLANSRAYELVEREYDVKRDVLKNQRAQIAVSQGQAKADQWYKEQSIALSREELSVKVQQHSENLAFEKQKFSETLAFDKQRHGETMGLNNAKLATDLRQTPQDLFRSLWFESNTAGDPTMSGNVAKWAQAFNPNQAPGTASPAYATGPATIGGLAASLTGQGGVGSQVAGAASAPGGWNGQTNYNSPGVQSTLAGLAAFGMSPQQAQPGYMERLSDTERAAVAGGLAETGYINDVVNAKYRRTRLPGTPASAVAA